MRRGLGAVATVLVGANTAVAAGSASGVEVVRSEEPTLTAVQVDRLTAAVLNEDYGLSEDAVRSFLAADPATQLAALRAAGLPDPGVPLDDPRAQYLLWGEWGGASRGRPVRPHGHPRIGVGRCR